MAIIKTLAEVQAKVLSLGNIKGQVGSGVTFRHPTDDIVADINTSFAEYRELLVARKFDYFLVETSQADLPSSRADTNEQYSVIDWPTTALNLRRIDVYQYGEWKALKEIDWARLRDVIPRDASATNRRVEFFSPRSQATASTTTQTAGKIALAPFSTPGKYKLTYLPPHTAITDSTHVFVFASEAGFMWVVWNTICNIAIRDTDKERRYVPAVAERQRRADSIGTFSAATVATGGTQMRRAPGYNG